MASRNFIRGSIRGGFVFSLGCFFLLFLSNHSFSATILVPDDYATIEAAIDASGMATTCSDTSDTPRERSESGTTWATESQIFC